MSAGMPDGGPFKVSEADPSPLAAVRQRSRARLRILLAAAAAIAVVIASYRVGGALETRFVRNERDFLALQNRNLQAAVDDGPMQQVRAARLAVAAYRRGEIDARLDVAQGKRPESADPFPSSCLAGSPYLEIENDAYERGLRDHLVSEYDVEFAIERLEAKGLKIQRSTTREISMAFRPRQLANEDLKHVTLFHGRLTALDLSNQPKVDDKAVVDLLDLDRLQTLSLAGTSVSPSGAARLRKGLPNCQIKVSSP